MKKNNTQPMGKRGAVLVVSLVMLAVVTFIIIAYLAFAQRDRTSVNMSIIQTQNRFLLETGRAHAQARVKGLVESTINYQIVLSQNVDGADPLKLSPALFKAEGLVLKDKARVPVFHDRNGNGNPFEVDDEFRYYLNLNRDEGVAADAIHPDRGGDPHWVGALEDPDSPHGPDNRFIGRYAYMIVPASKTLDLNHMHNNKKNANLEDGYMRGYGNSYSDLNLAGTLGALNPPMIMGQGQPWPYLEYSAVDKPKSKGTAFAHAALLFDYKNQKHIGHYSDVFDLFKPSRVKNQGLNYDGFTRLLGKTGKTAFYELAGSISTREQPPPTGLLNLNQYIPAVSIIKDSNFNGFVILEDPVSWDAGARVCIYGNNGVRPQVRLLNVPVPAIWQVQPNEIFYAKATSDSKNTLMLYKDSGPGSYLDEGNRIGIMPAPAGTVFRIDRSLEMFEEVTARLLRARANSRNPIISKDIVNVSEGGRPDFNITVDPIQSPENLNVIDQQWGNTEFQKEYRLQYSLEVERLLQVAANIVDVYTPGPYPSVFRPIFANIRSVSGRNRFGVNILKDKKIISKFTKEPDNSFLRTPSFSAANIASPLDRVNAVGHGGNKELFNMPLIIGAKNRWGDNHITPAINEISTRWIMKAGRDSTGPHMQPQLQTIIEIKDSSNGAAGMDLHVKIKEIEGIIYSHRTPNELARMDLPNPRDFNIPKINEVIRVSNPLTKTDENGNYWVAIPDSHPDIMRLDNEYQAGRIPDWEVRGYNKGDYVHRGSTFYFCNMAHNLPVQPTRAKVRLHSGGFWEIRMPAIPFKNGTTDIRFDYGRRPWEIVKNLGDRTFNIDVSFALTAIPAKQVLDFAELSLPVSGGVKVDPDWWNPNGSEISKNHQVSYNNKLYYYKLDDKPKKLDKDSANKIIFPENKWGELPSPGQFVAEYAEISWQVNDPLLNGRNWDYKDYYNSAFMLNTYYSDKKGRNGRNAYAPDTDLPSNIGKENTFSQAWKTADDTPPDPTAEGTPHLSVAHYYFKDPGAKGSSEWDFPKGRLRTIGDLGRIHRGTPWQTIYLKNDYNILDKPNMISPRTTLWREWVFSREQNLPIAQGNVNPGTELRNKSVQLMIDQTQPQWDHSLVNEFSVWPEGAPQMGGLLSVNQKNEPAWSAALSGIEWENGKYVAPGSEMRTIINGNIADDIEGINSIRGPGPWDRISTILEAPSLTTQSPYLESIPIANRTEAHYEAIPRQLLSLLRVEKDHYFIAYVYSQVLRPAAAQGSIIRKGTNKGLCINYQVVGEAGARTEFRVEKMGLGQSQVILEDYRPISIR